MLDLTTALPSHLKVGSEFRFRAPFILVGLLIGIIVARLPLLWAAIVLIVTILIILILIEPLVGLGVILLTGPTKPLTDYFMPELPLDLGQIAFIVTLGAWCLHTI